MSEFIKEPRYIVLKLTDINVHLNATQANSSRHRGIHRRETMNAPDWLIWIIVNFRAIAYAVVAVVAAVIISLFVLGYKWRKS